MRTLLIVTLLLLGAGIVTAQTETPTLEPTGTPTPDLLVPDDRANEALATAVNETGELPADISRPNGVPLVPDTGQSTLLFGYAKWFVSAAATPDLFGPFSPIANHIGLALTLVFAMSAIYISVYIIAYIVKFVIFLWRLILQVLQLIRG